MASKNWQKTLNFLSLDPTLYRAIASISLKEYSGQKDVYADLINAIISQQLSTKAASTIRNRFLNLFRAHYPKPSLLLRKTDKQLRSVGLSRQKAGYLRNIAHFAKKEKLQDVHWTEMNDEDITAFLTQIKGVGKWTAQMILMFSLHRPDVFPEDDLTIQNGMIELYDLKITGKALKPKLIKIAENWRPYRTTACRYIWKWKDLQ